MAFDITPYIDMKPSEVRKLIREGVIDFPTAGMCRGYAQANLIILPPEYAGDFEEFARRNPFPCPILEIVRGTPETHDMGEGGNICTDIPKYRIYRDGKWDGKELTDVSGYPHFPHPVQPWPLHRPHSSQRAETQPDQSRSSRQFP